MNGQQEDGWYRKETLRLAELLMDALHAACNINEADSLWKPIKEKIEALNLPKQKCIRCGIEMSWWDWAIRSHHCDTCIAELEEERRENEHSNSSIM